MEIWKRHKNGQVSKKPFLTKYADKPVEYLFDPAFPALSDLLAEELKKKNGPRMIVFSKEEEKQIYDHSKLYVNPGVKKLVASEFLNCVLAPLGEVTSKSFFVTYLSEGFNMSMVPSSGDRLAIAIENGITI